MAVASLYERCFVFSPTHADELLKLNSQVPGSKFKFGTVVVNGVSKDYTDIVVDMSRVRYPDSILLTRGDIRKIKFTDPGMDDVLA